MTSSRSRHLRLALFAACAALPFSALAADATPAGSFPVSIAVDAGKSLGEVKPIWRFFGADEPNYATMKDGQKLIAELGELKPKQVYFRAHSLLVSGDGTPALKWGSTNVYTEDAQGNPVYNWTVIDNIFDTYIARGVRPYAQIGFMPEALSAKPQPYRHSWRPGFNYNLITGGWAEPPKDYKRWEELVYQWVKHSVDRYGAKEVEQWYWEVWNEANGRAYWHGSPEDFQKLHDYALAGVRRALPTARVGGPDTAGHGGKFMDSFLDHVTTGTNYATGQTGTPTDFLSFHAKGQPSFVDGHVRMGISNHMKVMDEGFAKIAARPTLKHLPIVIGESDPEGCAACQGPQNGYRNGTMYSSYTAASFMRKLDLAAKHGVNLEGALTWAFEFEDQPYFAGFRALASNGLDLPVLNVFRMFSKMGGQRISAQSSGQIALEDITKNGVRDKPDIGSYASLDGRRLSIMVWHYHDDDVPGAIANVSLALNGLGKRNGDATLTHYRIDGEHSNSYAEWQRRGSPIAPNEKVYAEIEQAGKLATLGEAQTVAVKSGKATLDFALPRQGVSLLVLDLPAAR